MLGTFWIKFTNAALIFESCTWNKACVYSVGSSVSTSGGLNGKNVFDQCWSGWENVQSCLGIYTQERQNMQLNTKHTSTHSAVVLIISF